MPTPPLVLVVDDDAHIRAVVRFALEQAGFAVAEAADGAAGLQRALPPGRSDGAPDLIILDVLMPELDGLEAFRRLRAQSAVPVVFLTSRDDEIDRVVGLELGADDYVTKPFSPRELVARVRAVLRRARPAAPPAAAGDEARSHGRLHLHAAMRTVRWGDVDVPLTATEFDLLAALLGQPGRVYSRDELIDAARGVGHFLSPRTIDSHVRRARAKFAAVGAAPIETVHGVGYKLGPCR